MSIHTLKVENVETGTLSVHLKIQEHNFYWNEWQFKGRLLVAIPSKTKPKCISPETWATGILDATTKSGKFHLAIPRSFWQKSWGDCSAKARVDRSRIIDVMDAFSGFDDTDGHTPVDSVLDIIKILKQGEDVLIPSATKKISGFILAMLSNIANTYNTHPVKIWYPITGEGYELTPFQLGYIYGMYDANSSFGMNYLRETIK